MVTQPEIWKTLVSWWMGETETEIYFALVLITRLFDNMRQWLVKNFTKRFSKTHFLPTNQGNNLGTYWNAPEDQPSNRCSVFISSLDLLASSVRRACPRILKFWMQPKITITWFQQLNSSNTDHLNNINNFCFYLRIVLLFTLILLALLPNLYIAFPSQTKLVSIDRDF